jgi:signal transduction histidine kinase
VRLALWNVLILLLTLLLLGAVVYTVVSYNLQSSLDKRLLTQGEKLQGTTRIWLLTGHPINGELFEQLAQSMQQDEFSADDLYIKLFDVKTGKPLQYSPNLQQIRIHYTQGDFEAAVHGQTVWATYHDRAGNAVRIVTMPVLNLDHHPIAVAQIGRSLDGVHQIEVLLALVLCLGGGCALLIAYAMSFVLTGREVRPLSLLSAQMRTLSVRGLGVRLEPKGQMKEVQLLTEAFNQMSQRLEASFTLQRNFVADVSHELRTPLTALRGQVAVLLMNPDLDSEVGQDVRQIHAELIRLSHLVSNLLEMARVDVGVMPQVTAESAQRVELDLLLVEIARQARFLSQQVTVELGQLQQVWVRGEKDLLKQMLLNIVDNALIYTPAGGSVRLEVTAIEDIPLDLQVQQHGGLRQWAMISVTDTGPGIAPSDVPHIFERHYRAGSTRSRGRLGAGIGLSLARLFAQAHHGDITVASEIKKGSCFRIWLPLSYESSEQSQFKEKRIDGTGTGICAEGSENVEERNCDCRA